MGSRKIADEAVVETPGQVWALVREVFPEARFAAEGRYSFQGRRSQELASSPYHLHVKAGTDPEGKLDLQAGIALVVRDGYPRGMGGRINFVDVFEKSLPRMRAWEVRYRLGEWREEVDSWS